MSKKNKSRNNRVNNNSNFKKINASQDNSMRSNTLKFGMDPMTLEMPRKKFKLSELKFGIKFQRPINMNRVKKMVEEFDPVKARGILVAKIDDDWWIVDGQHRAKAIEMHEKYGPNAIIMCDYFEGMTYEEAAYYFSHQDDNKSKLSGYDRLNADYESGNKNAIIIIETLKKYGIKATSGGGLSKTNVTATATLKTSLYNLGENGFDQLIKIISSIDDDNRFADNSIKAFTKFLLNFGGTPGFKESRLLQRLNSPGEFYNIYNEAKKTRAGETTYNLMYLNIVTSYNKGLRNGRLISES